MFPIPRLTPPGTGAPAVLRPQDHAELEAAPHECRVPDLRLVGEQVEQATEAARDGFGARQRNGRGDVREPRLDAPDLGARLVAQLPGLDIRWILDEQGSPRWPPASSPWQLLLEVGRVGRAHARCGATLEPGFFSVDGGGSPPPRVLYFATLVRAYRLVYESDVPPRPGIARNALAAVVAMNGICAALMLLPVLDDRGAESMMLLHGGPVHALVELHPKVRPNGQQPASIVLGETMVAPGANVSEIVERVDRRLDRAWFGQWA